VGLIYGFEQRWVSGPSYRLGDRDDEETYNIKRRSRQACHEHPAQPRQTYSAEEKIRTILTGLRGEESILVLCRREGIAESLYYTWSKEFLEAASGRWLSILHGRRPLQR